MRRDSNDLVDKPFEPFAARDLLAFPDGAPPPGVLDLRQLFQRWKAASRAQSVASTDPAESRLQLQQALGVEWPAQVESVADGNRMVLSRPGKGDRVHGYWIPGTGTGTPVLLVHEAGIEVALRTTVAEQLVHSGRPLLLIDPFRSTMVQIRNHQAQPYFLSYNQTDDANRVQDILTALAFLKLRSGATVELNGHGPAAIWCLFAAAIAPIEIDLRANLGGFSGSDADFRNRFFVPGIQRAGGLRAALRLVKKTP